MERKEILMQVDQGGLALPERDFYLNKTISEDKILSAYLTYMTDVFTLLGAPNQTETRRKMEEVILFETELANITTPEEDRRDDTKLYHKMTLANLSHNYPHIKWVHLVNHLLSVVELNVAPTENVVVYAPEYLTALDAMLAKYQKTDEGKQ
ncbi:endothelin-converting enzyme 1 [Plakobranchus ocellatus]|uniref:Endothelin-converting enzyme 1 n=1 Tax=Plakobranchus ocellatus TaxID=259542 RepID=A0AAV3ZB40_9GAST|nr:endothelin-converting enzyme 1 [Plakobranchus ocellatus]